MNRRDFLTRLTGLGLVAVTPKLIFDFGANSHKYPSGGDVLCINPDWDQVVYEGMIMRRNLEFLTFTPGFLTPDKLYPKRYELDATSGQFIEIPSHIIKYELA